MSSASSARGPVSVAVDNVKATVGVLSSVPLGTATNLLLRQVLRQLVRQMIDDWRSADEQIDYDKEPLVRILESIIVRIDENDAEERSTTLATMRERNSRPMSWPPPPDRAAQPLSWLRARLLYAWCPADRDIVYALKHEQWMLLVPLLLACPGVANLAWLLPLCFLLTSIVDPYQLLNGIWTFKLFTLVMWGVLPILSDHAQLLIITTVPHPAHATSCAAAAHAMWPAVLDATFTFLTTNELICFYVNWTFCYFIYLKARRSIARKMAGDDCGLFTNDFDVDVYMLDRLMKYDLAVFVAFTIVQQLYLAYAVLGRSGLWGFISSVDPFAIESLLLEPIPPERHAQYLFHRSYAVNALALAAIPHALFKVPGLGELLHQIRLTGYDQAGNLRLMMSAPEMQTKWREQQRAGIHVSEVADTVIVSTTTAAGAVVGAASDFVASIAGTAGRIAGTGTGTAFGNGPVVQGRADLV